MPQRFQILFNGPVDANGLPISYDPGWQAFTNLTAAQQAWFRSQPQWLTQYVGTRRWLKEIGGIKFGGIAIDTTDASRSLIDGLAIRATRDQQSNPAATYTLTSNGSANQLTVAQALALFDAVSGFIQAARGVEGQMLAGINAAPPTITSEAQIDAALATVVTTF